MELKKKEMIIQAIPFWSTSGCVHFEAKRKKRWKKSHVISFYFYIIHHHHIHNLHLTLNWHHDKWRGNIWSACREDRHDAPTQFILYNLASHWPENIIIHALFESDLIGATWREKFGSLQPWHVKACMDVFWLHRETIGLLSDSRACATLGFRQAQQ